MACTPHKCGKVKTEYGPLGEVTVEATDGTLAGKKIKFQNVLDKATTLLQTAVNNAAKIEDDPDMTICDTDCECRGIVWTPRPSDDVPFTVSFALNGVSYSATVTVKETISDGVGRCKPVPLMVAMALIDQENRRCFTCDTQALGI